VGSASATTPKAATARSVCKPEERVIHDLITFCVISWLSDCSVFLRSSTHQR
jgi:hypothetical protein